MKKKIDINKLLHKPASAYERFHQKTKLLKSYQQLPSKKWPKEWKTAYFKAYARLEEIALPKPTLSPNSSLEKALETRRSIRKFGKEPVSLQELSTLLYYSAGIRSSHNKYQRFYPSGGARYPLELYFLSLHSELPKGIYHYYPRRHSLEVLDTFSTFETEKYFTYDWVENAAGVLIVGAVFKRSTIKYGDRGYRYILLEAGHFAQNVHLIASSLKLGTCGLGGYLDDAVNKLLRLDGHAESVIYTIALGHSE